MPVRSQALNEMTSAIVPLEFAAGWKYSRVVALAARYRGARADTVPTSSHDAPPSTEYQSDPPWRVVPVIAMPGRSPSASEKLLSTPPASTSTETSVPIGPDGAGASSVSAGSTSAGGVTSTGTSLTAVTATPTVSMAMETDDACGTRR